MPPIPPWSGFHVLVVHFPIALLMVAPILMVIGLIVRRHRMAWSSAAVSLMVMGSVAAFLATASGEAAEEAADLPDGIETVLMRHEHLAERARNAFAVLTVAYAAALLVVRYRWTARPLDHRIFIGATAVFLLAYAVPALWLADTAHTGGQIVHQFGVRSVMAETAATQPSATSGDSEKSEKHDD